MFYQVDKNEFIFVFIRTIEIFLIQDSLTHQFFIYFQVILHKILYYKMPICIVCGAPNPEENGLRYFDIPSRM